MQPLDKLTHEYLSCLVGVGESADAAERIEVFSPFCKKIINGQQVLSNADDFKKHLKQLREQTEKWSITLHEILICSDERTSVMRYENNCPPFGRFHIIAILRFNENNLLDEVNEVFHLMDA